MSSAEKRPLVRIVFLLSGLLLTGLGFLGLYLPLLPGTPFFLGAVFCFARSSRRLHDWLMSKPFIAETVRNLRDRGGLPRRMKVKILLTAFSFMAFSAVVVDKPLVYAILGMLFLIQLFCFLFVIKTLDS